MVLFVPHWRWNEKDRPRVPSYTVMNRKTRSRERERVLRIPIYWMIMRPQVSHSTRAPFLMRESTAEGREVLQPEH